ncbi:leucine-rich repeat protein [Perkinsela sp. CCAP 1560/4]|nr:leucine-rich repeat protein [Perkinsela sp. CCAP 1560/4]|eukprot:KNH08167.1 leucine-rich repeat protein [Perkinsela sp. CCAP 1560/4]
MFRILAAADFAMGRVSSENLSQQAIMEILVGDMRNTKHFVDDAKTFKSIADWPKVTLDEDENVLNADWTGMALGGSVDLSWLPSAMRLFSLRWNEMEGTANLSHLPKRLRCLYLSNNAFCGSPDLENLPRELERLDLSHNKFSGTLHFQTIPESLQRLHLSANSFSGTVDISALPESIHHFSISHNMLTGVLDLRGLKSTKNFGFWDNKFEKILQRGDN